MKSLWIVGMIGVLCACAGSPGRRAVAEKTPAVPGPIDPPAVPSMIVDPVQRAEYLAAHWWDGFAFGDTLYVDQPEVTEQYFVDWLPLLDRIGGRQADREIDRMMTRAEACPAMYDYLIGLAEKYFYDPNSPLRDEDRYLAVLRHIDDGPCLDSLEKLRYRSQLKVALRNRPGDRACDFVWEDMAGRRGTLYGVEGDYVLLFFYNPGCAMCRDLRVLLARTPFLDDMVRRGTLRVLAVYPDEALDEWRAYRDSIPDGWINARDPQQALTAGNVYDLRAIPSLYLLDRDKRVILKDCVDMRRIVDTLARREGVVE